MKLTDLKNEALLEGRVDPNVKLSIEHLVAAQGKNPNTFQLLMVARVMAGLKEGYFYKDTNYWESLYSVSSDMMNTLRSLPPEELCALACKCQEVLEMKDKDKLYTMANPQQELASYLKWVTACEANESLEEAVDVNAVLDKIKTATKGSKTDVRTVFLGGGSDSSSYVKKLEGMGFDSAGGWAENKDTFKKWGVSKAEYDALCKASL